MQARYQSAPFVTHPYPKKHLNILATEYPFLKLLINESQWQGNPCKAAKLVRIARGAIDSDENETLNVSHPEVC
jgi:hypothetical protein